MKYEVGQTLNVSMRTGFHYSEIVDKKIVIDKIEGNMITIKCPLKGGGHKKMFGTESELDKLVDWYNERHKKLDDMICLADEKIAKQCSMQNETMRSGVERVVPESEHKPHIISPSWLISRAKEMTPEKEAEILRRNEELHKMSIEERRRLQGQTQCAIVRGGVAGGDMERG